MSGEKNCIHFLPKELGHAGSCVMFGLCNKLGSRCVGFMKHTKETRKALSEAIEMKKMMEFCKRPAFEDEGGKK